VTAPVSIPMNRVDRRRLARRLAKKDRRSLDAERSALLARMPVTLRDQLDAARRDVAETVRDPRFVSVRASERLRTRLAETLAVVMAGELRRCVHVNLLAPCPPLFVGLWEPDRVFCARERCRTTLSGTEDLRCDLCGRVCEGLPADPIYPDCAAVEDGAVLFLYGACSRCRADITAA
jgi:hypothetical protein